MLYRVTRLAANGNRNGSPVVIEETMTRETPPISTIVTGTPEMIIDGTDGLFVESCDTDALTEALSTMVENGGRRQAMGQNARKTIQEAFSLEVPLG